MFWAQVPVITSISIKAWSLYKTDETLQIYMIMVRSRSTISILTLQAMSGLAAELYFPNQIGLKKHHKGALKSEVYQEPGKTASSGPNLPCPGHKFSFSSYL